jgi:hypothetical protein
MRSGDVAQRERSGLRLPTSTAKSFGQGSPGPEGGRAQYQGRPYECSSRMKETFMYGSKGAWGVDG